ncbi:MAG: hypothetical protein HY696_09460 [Deltaproteobacteria bacterium]|nr:hypothetical protein [Deltaproteobacteria bacterium]
MARDALDAFHTELRVQEAYGPHATALVGVYRELTRRPRAELTFEALRPYTDALLAALEETTAPHVATPTAMRAFLPPATLEVEGRVTGEAVLQGGLAAGSEPVTSHESPATPSPPPASFDISIEGVPMTDLVPFQPPAAAPEVPPFDITIAGEKPTDAVTVEALLPGVTRLYRRLATPEAVTPIECATARNRVADQLTFLGARKMHPLAPAEISALRALVDMLLTDVNGASGGVQGVGAISATDRFAIICALAQGIASAQDWLVANSTRAGMVGHGFVLQGDDAAEVSFLPRDVNTALRNMTTTVAGLTTVTFTIPATGLDTAPERIDLEMDDDTRRWIAAILTETIDGRMQGVPRALRTGLVARLAKGPNFAREYVIAVLRANFIESRILDPEEVALPMPRAVPLRVVDETPERPALPGTRVSAYTGTADSAEDAWTRLDTAWKELGAARMMRPDLWNELAGDTQLAGTFGTSYATVMIDGEAFARTPVDGLGRLQQQVSELLSAHGALDEQKALNRWLRNAIAEGVFPAMSRQYLREQGHAVSTVMQSLQLALERVRERSEGTALDSRGVPYPPLPAVSKEQIATAQALVDGTITRLRELGGTEMAGKLEIFFADLQDESGIFVHLVTTQRVALTQRVYSVLGGQSPQTLRRLFAVYCDQVRARIEYLIAIFAGTAQALGDGSTASHVLPALHSLPSIAQLERQYPLSGPTPTDSFQTLVLRAGLPAAGMAVFGFLPEDDPAGWYQQQTSAANKRRMDERAFAQKLLEAHVDLRNRFDRIVAERRAAEAQRIEAARRRGQNPPPMAPEFGQLSAAEITQLERQADGVENYWRGQFGMTTRQLPASALTSERADQSTEASQ